MTTAVFQFKAEATTVNSIPVVGFNETGLPDDFGVVLDSNLAALEDIATIQGVFVTTENAVQYLTVLAVGFVDPEDLPQATVLNGVRYINDDMEEVEYLLSQATSDEVDLFGQGTTRRWRWPLDGVDFTDSTQYEVALLVSPAVSFNCECDDTVPYETLSQLRTRMLVRLGYSAQAATPPPGMTTLLDDFLRSAQRTLYMKYTELRTERFFTWTMEPGVRFYDLPENEDACTKSLNALKLTWAGVEDLNGAWLPLISGIPPEFYTGISQRSLPERYEIRQCIEVFPAPDQAYTLRIKGHFNLLPFTADADQTTIDSELVFLWALAVAKAHYGQPDANNVAAMANDYLGRLVGGKHGTRRYVPGAVPIPPAVRPVMRDGFDA